MNKTLTAMLLLTIFCVSQAAPGFAGHKKKFYSYNIFGLEHLFLEKAYFLIEKQEEFKLTSEQFTKIRGLKTSLKEDIIRQGAELDVLNYKLLDLLADYTVNEEKAEALIEEKHELEKKMDKRLVGAFSELKAILTEEQQAQYQNYWKTHFAH